MSTLVTGFWSLVARFWILDADLQNVRHRASWIEYRETRLLVGGFWKLVV
jgi:hypothetical protein